MTLVDANLLLYAFMDGYPQHQRARAWLREQINGPSPVGLPLHCLLAFLRISTNPRAFAIPASTQEACTQVEEWLALPSVWIPQPTEKHTKVLLDLLCASGTRGNRTSDAHLAALAIEHGLTICSADSDFARFSGVRWMNPLAP